MTQIVSTLASFAYANVGTQTFVVASEAEMLVLEAKVGDVAVRTDIDEAYILSALPPSVLANWVNLTIGGVTSFNGRNGLVVPQINDYSTSIVAEGTNQYFTNSRALTAVGKANDPTGYTLSGGTTAKYLYVKSDCLLDQDLAKTATVEHARLSIVDATPIFSLNDITVPAKSFVARLDEVNKCALIEAQNVGTEWYDIKLGPNLTFDKTIAVGYSATDGISAYAGVKPKIATKAALSNYTLIDSNANTEGCVLSTLYMTQRYNTVGGTTENTVWESGLFCNTAASSEQDHMFWGRSGLEHSGIRRYRDGNVSIGSETLQPELFHVGGNMSVLAEVKYKEIETPATPVDSVSVYSKSDGKLYALDKAGVEHDIFAGENTVTSVFSRIGAVVAQAGDYNTSLVTENTNLYFTNTRALVAVEKVNATEGYTLSGGTETTKVLSVEDDSAVNQNLRDTDSPTFNQLTLLGAMPQLKLIDSDDLNTLCSLEYDSSTNSGYLTALNSTTGFHAIRVNSEADFGRFSVGRPKAIALPQIYGGNAIVSDSYSATSNYSTVETGSATDIISNLLITPRYTKVGGDGNREDSAFEYGLFQSTTEPADDRIFFGRPNISTSDLAIHRSGRITINEPLARAEQLYINGDARLTKELVLNEIATPTQPTNSLKIYSKSDGKLYVLDKNNVEHDIFAGENTVTSVFTRTGDVEAAEGDYNTDLVTEANNLYFTEQRVLDTFKQSPTVIPVDIYANPLQVYSENQGTGLANWISATFRVKNGFNADRVDIGVRNGKAWILGQSIDPMFFSKLHIGYRDYATGIGANDTDNAVATLHGFGSTVFGAENSELTDASLQTSSVNVWQDNTNDILTFKAKNASNVVTNYQIKKQLRTVVVEAANYENTGEEDIIEAVHISNNVLITIDATKLNRELTVIATLGPSFTSQVVAKAGQTINGSSSAFTLGSLYASLTLKRGSDNSISLIASQTGTIT